jgi:hypothetical protein
MTAAWQQTELMCDADPHPHLHSPYLALQQQMLALQQQQQGYLGHMAPSCNPMLSGGSYSHVGHHQQQQQQHVGHAVLSAAQQQHQQPYLMKQALPGVMMYGGGSHPPGLHPPEQQQVLQVQESPQQTQLQLAAPFSSNPGLTASPDHVSDGSGLEVISSSSTAGGGEGSVAPSAAPHNNALLLQLLVQQQQKQQQQLYELQHLAAATVGPVTPLSSPLEAHMMNLGLGTAYMAASLLQQQQQQLHMPYHVQLPQQLLLQQQQQQVPLYMPQLPAWHH